MEKTNDNDNDEEKEKNDERVDDDGGRGRVQGNEATEDRTGQSDWETTSQGTNVDPDEEEGGGRGGLGKTVTESSVVYEWMRELEEYDEPDVYPSEKDYKWFEELVTDSEEEIEEEVKVLYEVKNESDKVVEDKKDTVEQDGKEKQQEGEETGKEGGDGGVGEEEEAEDTFVPTVIVEQEEEVEEAPKKRYKTVKVRKLVERPPKIYHVPEKVRIEEKTNSYYDFPSAPFRFLHSFGYDCQRLANLIVLDTTTLMFMSGFVLTLYDYIKFTKKYLRSLRGGSFGSVAIHPSRKLFAAAEMAAEPIIGIWSWPKLQLFRKLEEGTEKVYASVNFSPDGKLLASQGGKPDYLITVWNWLAETPVLRVKSHAQDVFRVTFAKDLAGLLTTSGVCHIKFWKMARTFTGLKLKGDLGRFGRTELSDIEGYVEMPDGKVLSGSEWGNLLVWENGLVIAELCTANNVPCHSGIVRQISIVEGDFFTTGQDGRIRVWVFDEVDTAEIHTSTESLKVAIKPLSGVVVHEEADIWSIFQDPFHNDDMSVFWFAQDGKGYIWKVDLSFLNIAKEPSIVLTAHGGPIVGGCTSPFDFMIATLGEDGKVLIHDYITKQRLAQRSFSAAGSCLLWPSKGACADGCTLIAGFADGVLRILGLSGQPTKSSDAMPLTICLRRVWKPHRNKINSVSLDMDGEFLVTGSEDGTVFFFHASNDFLPMVFVNPAESLPVHKVFWNKPKENTEQKVVIAICKGSLIQEIEMPALHTIDNSTSYSYQHIKLLRNCRVKSIKSVLRHNEELTRKRIAEEKRQKVLEKENQRLLDEGIETPQDQIARLLEEAEEIERTRAEEARIEKKWTPYIPLVPNSILEIVPDLFDSDTFHLTIDGYDSGYIYSVRLVNDDNNQVTSIDGKEPVNAVAIEDSGDVPVNKMVIINQGTEVLIGFQDGRLRIARMEYPYDFESLQSHWTMGTHDLSRGQMTSIALDRDEAFIFTTAMDGNCFMHTFLGENELKEIEASNERQNIEFIQPRKDVYDILLPDAYTLEDSKNIEKERAILATIKRNKAARKERIQQLRIRFAEIVYRNNELPPGIRLTPVELSLAPDSAQRLEKRSKQGLKQVKTERGWHCEHAKVALEKIKSFYVDRVYCQLFTVKALSSSNRVSSFRLPNYPDFFDDAKMKNKMREGSKFSDWEGLDEEGTQDSIPLVNDEPKPKRKRGMDKFVHQKLVRLWQRRQKRLQRKREWEQFLKTDPSGQELEDDMAQIDQARLNIGDMKLKIDPKYKVPDALRLTVKRARKRLIVLEEKMFELQKAFNDELISLRTYKIKTLSRIEDLREKLKVCQQDLPESLTLPIPELPLMTVEEDPDSLVKVKKEDVLSFKQQKEATKVTVVNVSHKATKKMDTTKKRPKKSGVDNWVETVETVIKETDIGAFVSKITYRPSPLELQIKQIKITKASSYQKYYLECIEKEKFKFDAMLKLLKHKKVKLDYDLKIAEARMIILTEEFILAQKSVAMEAKLESSVKAATTEKRVCTNAMKALQKTVDNLKKEQEYLSNQRAVLLREVLEIASVAPNYEKYLIRVFRKRITLNKMKANNDDEDDVESDNSDDSDDSDDMNMDDDDDESEDGLDVDLPPQDLKNDIYDAVVEVRNRRLWLDEADMKIKTTLDDLTAQINGYKSRIDFADKTFQHTMQEVDQFNLEKQSKLNSIEDTVSLNLNQVMYMNTDLEKALVTNRADIKRLRNRIPELKKERRIEKNLVLSTKKEYHRLQHEQDRFKQRLVDKDQECDKELMVKFGRIKHVTELENFCEDPEITRLKRELAQLQERAHQTLNELEHQISSFNDEFLILERSQTAKTRLKVDMHVQLNAIKTAMNAQLGVMPLDVEENRAKVETLRLQEMTLRQHHVIQALKDEIVAITTRYRLPLPPIQQTRPGTP